MNARITSLVVAAALSAAASAQFYAQRTVPVRAAVALIDSYQVAGNLVNNAPFVFYNLENNRRIRPAAYSFTNSAHETQFTAATSARWTALAGASPVAGTIVDRRHAPYWELRLTTATDSQLAALDIILLPAHGTTILNPVEREKLRKFVEQGGVLWVDFAGTSVVDPINNLPFPATLSAASLGANVSTDFSQPLVSFPASVTANDLYLMQSDGVNAFRYLNLAANGLGAQEPILASLMPDSTRLSPVSSDDKGAILLTGQLGDGYIVVTTRGVASTLNRVPNGVGYSANVGAVALPPTSDRSGDAAGKLVVNMINLVSGYAQPRGGSRSSGATKVDLNAPQLSRFADDSNPMLPGSPFGYRPPTVFKGFLIVTTLDRVMVYDANPKQDLDGDGNPDDGVVDFASGSPFDLVWASDTIRQPSAPVCFEVPNASRPELLNQVAVTDLDGTVHGFNLTPYTAGGSLAATLTATPEYSVASTTGAASWDLGMTDAGPYPPIFHEGYLWIGDVQDLGLSKSGRIWVVDPATGTQVVTGATGWSIGGASASALPDPSSAPTVGYVPILDNSGGMDKVIYWPGRPNPLIPGPNGAASITSVWVGARGERPTAWTQTAAYLEVQTRAASQGLDIYLAAGASDSKGLGTRLAIVKANGDPYTPAEMSTVFSGGVTQANGIVRFMYNAGQAILPTDQVRVDYTIDFGTGLPSTVQQALRGQINLPDDGDRSRRILHGIGLSPKGTMHLTFSSQDSTVKAGGAYFAIREEGRGNFKVVNRFDLYNTHVITLNQATTTDVTYPDTFTNTDPLVSFVPFLAGPMRNLTYIGGPVVRNGVVYVTAKAVKAFGFASIPYTVVLAFRAEPEVMEIRTGELSAGFAILQPDMCRSIYTVGGRPDTYGLLQASQYEYEAQGNNAGVIRLDNLASSTRGPILNCMSTSQPVVIRQNGRNDILVEPSTGSSRWSQLLWYNVFSGVDCSSPAFVSGDTMFVAGASSWPSILAGTGFTPVGQIFGFDTQISPNDSYLVSGEPARPWFKQLYWLKGVLPNVTPNPALLWPNLTGITTWADYQVRLQQTVMQMNAGGYSSMAHGVVGGDGGLFAWSDNGIWGYGRADFWIADEGRILRADSAGQPRWAMSSTFRTGQQGDTGAAGESRPLVRPTRAYPLGDREVMIVDTGANRIIHADVSGRELRSVANYILDPTFTPTGLAANERHTLSGPRDAVRFTSIEDAAGNPFSNAQPYEYWVHWVIADTDNKRVVELVDRYAYDVTRRQIGSIVQDSGGQRAVGVLYWHSPSQMSGGRFAYSSLSRVFNGTNWVYAAGIGNVMPTRADLGLDAPSTAPQRLNQDGNGGIVIFDGAATEVINEVNLPAIGANVFRDDMAGTFTSPAEPARLKKLGGLNSVTMRMVNTLAGPQLAVMFTDSEGVWEVVRGGTGWDVRWMLDRRAYVAIRRDAGDNLLFGDNPEGFLPTYAKRLESNEVLLCNGFQGFYRRALLTDPRVGCTGEVVLLDGDEDPTGTNPFGFSFAKTNLGFRTLSIRALLNNKPGASTEMRGIVLPFFADKQ